MGAGIPCTIPSVLPARSRGEASSLKVYFDNPPADDAGEWLDFDLRLFSPHPPKLKRRLLLAIVSSAAIATTLARKSTGKVDGFVVEASTACGHNAPPRGPMRLSTSGEPVYGPRDEPELTKFRELGLPFWIAR
jgi:nitronate monooxygenase